MALDTDCNSCGDSDWSKVVETDYPERRRDRDRTIKTVYECQSCGAEGRHFEHQDGGTDTYSGAMR